jgi:hypothetical protein
MNKIIVMNHISKDWEQQINKDTISGGQIFWGFQRYSNTIKIILGFGNSSFSCIKNNLGTSVPIPQTEGTVFPNPTTGEVNIETEDTLIKGIKIYDANGAEVSQGIDSRFRGNDNDVSDGKVQFNVSNLPSGEYFIVLEGKVKQTYKLIINK